MSVINELERLEKAATGGKWSSGDCSVGPECWCKTVTTDTQPEDWGNNYVVPEGAVGRKDADFIAASRNAFPALLRLVRWSELFFCCNIDDAEAQGEATVEMQQALRELGVEV